MKILSATSTAYAQKTPTEVSREVRQATQAKGFQETIEKSHQAERRHEEGARLAQAAFKDSLDNSSPVRKEDSIDRMVRAVAKQHAEERRQQTESARQQENVDQTDAARDKVNQAYGEESGSVQTEDRPKPETSEPNPRQQQQGAESYSSATRNSVDRTVELVI